MSHPVKIAIDNCVSQQGDFTVSEIYHAVRVMRYWAEFDTAANGIARLYNSGYIASLGYTRTVMEIELDSPRPLKIYRYHPKIPLDNPANG